MNKIDNKKLCEILNAFVEDELKAVYEYDELLEIMEHTEHRNIIKEIMKEEFGHAVEFKKIATDMGCPESETWQEMEDLLKVIEEKHGKIE